MQKQAIIIWPSPGAIAYGTPLGGGQLDATANVPGTFTSSPALGTVLGVGNRQTLAVVFTPFDTTDYIGGSASTTINVEPNPPPGLSVQTHSFSGRVRH